jgi:transposase
MNKNQWSLSHTSAVFNLSSPGILSKWLSDYNAKGIVGLEPERQAEPMKNKPRVISNKSSEEMSDEELRNDIEYLRTEHAVLKK